MPASIANRIATDIIQAYQHTASTLCTPYAVHTDTFGMGAREANFSFPKEYTKQFFVFANIDVVCGCPNAPVRYKQVDISTQNDFKHGVDGEMSFNYTKENTQYDTRICMSIRVIKNEK